jgi:hypothetical protein
MFGNPAGIPDLFYLYKKRNFQGKTDGISLYLLSQALLHGESIMPLT